MEEQWRDISGYEGLYQVSNLGRVKSLPRMAKSKNDSYRAVKEAILKHDVRYLGYHSVCLCKYNRKANFFVHRLVWSAFHGPIPKGMHVNHIDEDPTNNRLENLNLMTPKENTNWGTCIKRRSRTKKKPILQMDLYGNVIMGWLSSTDCMLETGMGKGNINMVCKGKRLSAYGFKWCYAS